MSAESEDQRVLAVIQGSAYGGAHNQVVRLHQRLSSRGFATTVLMTNEAGNASSRLHAEGIDVRLERLRRIRAHRPLATIAYVLTFRLQVQRLRAHIRSVGASIVQAHGITNFDVAIAGRLEGAAVVWQILDTRAPAFLRYILSPVVVRLADAILATGTTILDVYPAIRPASGRTYSYFPPVNDRSTPEIAEARARGRASLGLQASDIAVGCLANFNPQKGHDQLIEAFARVRRRQPTARLFIRGASSAGHEGYLRSLNQLVARTGLREEAVGSLSPDLAPGDFVAALDIFCLSAAGRSEGTPTVVIEAMQAGVPIVATAAGGVADLFTDGLHGFLVPVGDKTALTSALDHLVADPLLRARMGASARRHAQVELSIDRCEAAYFDAYSKALERATRRRVSGLTRDRPDQL